MTVAQAIQILHMHKHETRGIGKAPGRRWRPPPTLNEQGASILRKLNAFERSRKLGEAQKAKDREQWALRRGSGHARRGPSN